MRGLVLSQQHPKRSTVVNVKLWMVLTSQNMIQWPDNRVHEKALVTGLAVACCLEHKFGI